MLPINYYFVCTSSANFPQFLQDGAMRGFARAGALLCRPTACALAVRTVRAMSTQIPGYATKYTVLKSGEGAAVAKGKTVTVHATGVVQETGKTFWSTKDPDQEPFTYQAGVGQVITGWDQGILGMTLGTHLLHASAARPLSRPPAGAPYGRSLHAQARSES